jgi:hypothetical protein
MMALTGPVRHVDTEPTSAERSEPSPQAMVTALTGGLWPATSSTTKPWAFCAASTVMVSGRTRSTIAAQENSGQ